jgi:HD superfamily phosphodiesterase
MFDWLTELQTELTQITLPLARQYWPGLSPKDEPYYNYRLEHVKQVERDSRRLMAVTGGDEDIVLASVWIHDRFKPQLEGDNHASRAALWARQHLEEKGFPTVKISRVEYAVANHANPPQTIPATAREAQILWDADKLSKLGAVLVVYMLCTCQAYPQNKVNFKWILKEMRSWVEKGRELPPHFYFQLSRDLGHERWNTLRNFCASLEKEVGDLDDDD